MPKYALIEKLTSGNLVKQIALGIVAGIVLAQVWPAGASGAMLLGHLFVQALKAVAPVLVLVLVASALANQEIGNGARLRPIVGLYLAATFSAALLAVV
ncbi:MAG: serine/threonine transporter SstT, partial [Gammaproteobacteria bacterium]|nr:serine/threonine transporter SstT [Gammaproteobacteria bacterium]